MANGTTIFERSCKRLIDYLDGQIGKTFSGSFCYEKKISTYTRKLGKECICVKNLCNSDVDRNETEDVILHLLKKIDSNVYSLKNISSPSSMLKPKAPPSALHKQLRQKPRQRSSGESEQRNVKLGVKLVKLRDSNNGKRCTGHPAINTGRDGRTGGGGHS